MRRRPGSLRTRAGRTTTSAPSTSTPPVQALTGLSSTDDISGWSSASTDSRAMRSASAARCTGAAPRWPASSGAALTPSMRSVTSTSVSGGMRWATSPSSSVGRSGDGEADDGTEERVLARPHDARHAGHRHALHDEAVGSERSEAARQRGVGVAHRLGVDEVAAHADEAGLVAHDGRGRLEDDGVGERVGGAHGRLDAGDLDGRPEPDAVGREQLAGLVTGQGPPLGVGREDRLGERPRPGPGRCPPATRPTRGRASATGRSG